jgi:hypothetical protein
MSAMNVGVNNVGRFKREVVESCMLRIAGDNFVLEFVCTWRILEVLSQLSWSQKSNIVRGRCCICAHSVRLFYVLVKCISDLFH